MRYSLYSTCRVAWALYFLGCSLHETMHGGIWADAIVDSSRNSLGFWRENFPPFPSRLLPPTLLPQARLNVASFSLPDLPPVPPGSKMPFAKLQNYFQAFIFEKKRLTCSIRTSPFKLSFPASESPLLHSAMSVLPPRKVVVASKNPVKVNAAASAFRKTFPNLEFSFEMVEADSGVSRQPMSCEETLRGARNRARGTVVKSDNAEFVVAIEGGVEMCHISDSPSLLCFAWAVILSHDKEGVAKTAAFMLPPPIADLVSGGMELGEADDNLFFRSNSKHKNGTVDLLTDDVITRQTYYEHAICLALIPFVNPQLYKSPSMPEISKECICFNA